MTVNEKDPAVGCGLVLPINQNCSFLHQSCSVISDHLISSSASKHSVIVIPSKNTRKVTLRDWTINCPENKDSAGWKQYTIRNIEVKEYILTLKYATLCKKFILGLTNKAFFLEKKISTWCSLSVKLIGVDRSLRGWILHERRLEEMTKFSEMPRSNESTFPSRDAYDSSFGVVVSPGNLVIASVHCFDVDKLNRMYEGRVLRAAIDYFWIGGLQMDVWLKSPFSRCIDELPSFLEKELTYWGTNIIWSLNQYQCLEKAMVLWDLCATSFAFMDYNSKYVEHLVIKWLSLSLMESPTNLLPEEVLSRLISRQNSSSCANTRQNAEFSAFSAVGGLPDLRFQFRKKLYIRKFTTNPNTDSITV
ncbi:hypothetical protein KIW84_066567 [Lathyrus oleraceus]|uniref:Uncharacterized protein n=1 Tax=Pisum sativum TaxID=3888 RepID=A0A9D5ABD2_PEA|nr:hypothetical protein KIW84_066567 [Pisum sativum]